MPIRRVIEEPSQQELPDTAEVAGAAPKNAVHVLTMSTQLQQMMTPEALSEHLSLSVKTLAEWRQAGKGPRHIRLGTGNAAVRYLVDDVAAWVASLAADAA